MHADFFGHLLDHHGFQLVDASFEEILLARDDAIANLRDGLLALLDVLDQLDGTLIALFDVIACALFVGTVARDQLLVGRIEAKLRQVFVVHDDQPFIPMLHEGDVRLDQSSLNFVIAKTRTGVERANVLESLLHGFDRTANRFGNFFMLFVLNAAKVVVDDSHGILQNLSLCHCRSYVAPTVSDENEAG